MTQNWKESPIQMRIRKLYCMIQMSAIKKKGGGEKKCNWSKDREVIFPATNNTTFSHLWLALSARKQQRNAGQSKQQ